MCVNARVSPELHVFARLVVVSVKPLFTLEFCTCCVSCMMEQWFRLDGGYLIETSLGSRQGCKFGAIIFKLMYCRALDDL